MISPRLNSKLEQIQDRHEELARLLADEEIVGDREQYPKLSKEYRELEPVVREYSKYLKIENDLAEANLLIEEKDTELRELAEETIAELAPTLQDQTEVLQQLLLPRDPDDQANVFLEIRAGTGGDEAGLFVADLLNMYCGYASSNRWKHEIVNANATGIGGFKQVIVRLEGNEVYSRLKFESGAHRVQRVPKTESQGRIHTSACTVAVMPLSEELEEISIDRSDLRIDTYRASGAGGQHVNKTDSAVRITHLPTGTVAESQQERSQTRNREIAMTLLTAKIRKSLIASQKEQEASDRKAKVGSGDRSERIRTYNFPQGRITDHRINLTIYKLDEVLAGELDQVIEPLLVNHQAELLHQLQSQDDAVGQSARP